MTDVRDVSTQAYARLKQRAERPIRVALMGEFSSGKSTLLNLLAADNVAPTQVIATHVPSLWLHGSGGPNELVFANGARAPIHGDWQSDARLSEAAAVRLAGYADLPGGCEIIDTPGISDPLLAAGALEWAERHADIALWCTPAPQAWRQSEKAAWLARPNWLRDRSFLVVTQSDRLKATDISRVVDRLIDEAHDLFVDILPVAAPVALEPNDGYARSGLSSLVEAIAVGAAELRSARATLLGRYRITEDVSAEVAPAEEAVRAASGPAERVGAGAPAPLHAADAVACWDMSVAEAAPGDGPRVVVERFLSTLAAANPDIDLTAVPWFGLVRSVPDTEAGARAPLLNQMRGEIADFHESAWCDLATA